MEAKAVVYVPRRIWEKLPRDRNVEACQRNLQSCKKVRFTSRKAFPGILIPVCEMINAKPPENAAQRDRVPPDSIIAQKMSGKFQ